MSLTYERKMADFCSQNISDLETEKQNQAPRSSGKLMAFCTSFNCSSIRYNKKGGYYYKKFGLLKEVRLSESFCPDCNCALYWAKESEVKTWQTNNSL